jgi:hypothetical protein
VIEPVAIRPTGPLPDALRVGLVALAILAINLPFGFWRAGLRKLSPRWFVAVHAPVPLAIGLRWYTGLPFRLLTLPLFVAAFFAGQFLGGRIRRLTAHPPPGGPEG